MNAFKNMVVAVALFFTSRNAALDWSAMPSISKVSKEERIDVDLWPLLRAQVFALKESSIFLFYQ